MSLKIDIDVEQIARQFQEFRLELEADLRKGLKELSVNTHAHIIENVRNGAEDPHLNTTKKQYIDNLSKPTDPDGTGSLWVITLDSGGLPMEDGYSAFDMKEGLLKGASHKVIPFDHNKIPQMRSETDKKIMQELSDGLRSINKDRKAQGQSKISLTKIEKNPDGSPRVGRLHELDIDSSKPTAASKHPALKGLAIYQSVNKETGKVSRDVMTFRTVSKDSDGWKHPGFAGVHYFEKAYEWANQHWDNVILPKIMEKYGK